MDRKEVKVKQGSLELKEKMDYLDDLASKEYQETMDLMVSETSFVYDLKTVMLFFLQLFN